MLNIISTTTLNIPVSAPNNEPKQHKKASVHRTEAFLSNLNDIQLIIWTP